MPKPWRPVLASATKCCAAEDAAVAPDGLARCRPQQSELSRRLASFRRLSSLANSPASAAGTDKDGGSVKQAGEMAGPLQLHSFGLGELRGVTHDFASSFLLGEGGFGAVYKGFVDAGMRPGLAAQPVAVKQLNAAGFQGHREWLAEVIFLGQFRHSHLVRLLGYCCEDEERLLVYEFMPRGSLENHLFRSRYPWPTPRSPIHRGALLTSCVHAGISATLPWGTRLKVAIGAAKGLAFLHAASTPVIYRDFKASNILLDTVRAISLPQPASPTDIYMTPPPLPSTSTPSSPTWGSPRTAPPAAVATSPPASWEPTGTRPQSTSPQVRTSPRSCHGAYVRCFCTADRDVQLCTQATCT